MGNTAHARTQAHTAAPGGMSTAPPQRHASGRAKAQAHGLPAPSFCRGRPLSHGRAIPCPWAPLRTNSGKAHAARGENADAAAMPPRWPNVSCTGEKRSRNTEPEHVGQHGPRPDTGPHSGPRRHEHGTATAARFRQGKGTGPRPASAFFLSGPSFVSWPGNSLPVGAAENEQRKGARGEGRKRRRGGHASPMAERLMHRRKTEPEHRAGARRATRPTPGHRPTQRPGGMSAARFRQGKGTGARPHASAFFLPGPSFVHGRAIPCPWTALSANSGKSTRRGPETQTRRPCLPDGRTSHAPEKTGAGTQSRSTSGNTAHARTQAHTAARRHEHGTATAAPSGREHRQRLRPSLRSGRSLFSAGSMSGEATAENTQQRPAEGEETPCPS